MTVADLIEILKSKPQDMKVIYRQYSERTMLKEVNIEFEEGCEPEPDGWVQNARPDKPSQTYLCFP